MKGFAQKVLDPAPALADDSKIAQRFIAGNAILTNQVRQTGD